MAGSQSFECVESFIMDLFSARMVLFASEDIAVIYPGSNSGEEANECTN